MFYRRVRQEVAESTEENFILLQRAQRRCKGRRGIFYFCFTAEYAKKPQRTQVISDYVTTEDAKRSQRAQRNVLFLFYRKERKEDTESAEALFF